MLRVFHAGPWPEPGGEITLHSSESNHLVRVRRARVDESIALLDVCGSVAECTLALADGHAARVRVERVTRHPPPPIRVLAVGLPKGDLFTEIIRQATELSATAIQPLLTNRTEVHLDNDRVAHKKTRWQAAAVESCKQSGNPWIPEIHDPMELPIWLKSLAPNSLGELRLVAALTPKAVPLGQILTPGSPLPASCLIAIGPEGDFTPGEYTLFEKSGFAAVQLPGHVLRVETACAAALALLNANGA